MNYKLEVLLDNNKPVNVYSHEGQDYIEGRKNSQYKLKFTNLTQYSVEVILSVDGLDVIKGQPAGTESRGYIVSPYDSITVPGWKIDNTKVAAFKFRPQGDSNDKTYVESLKEEGFDVDKSNQGVIGFMVFREQHMYQSAAEYFGNKIRPWNYDDFGIRMYNPLVDKTTVRGLDMQPMNMCSMNASLSASSSVTRRVNLSSQVASVQEDEKSLGTGWGEETSYSTRQVSFTRLSETPDLIYTVVYDTLVGLKKRGVPVNQEKPVQNAFPAYKPNQNGCYVPKNKR